MSSNGKKRSGDWERQRTPGPFFRGEGFTFASDELLYHEFTHALNATERDILLVINKLVWRNRDVIIEAAAKFIVDNSCLKKRTVERHLSPKGRLRVQGFLRLLRKGGEDEGGNEYIAEPVFIWSDQWHNLRNFEKTMLVHVGPRRFNEKEKLIRSELFSQRAPLRKRQVARTIQGELTPEEITRRLEKAKRQVAPLVAAERAAADHSEPLSPVLG